MIVEVFETGPQGGVEGATPKGSFDFDVMPRIGEIVCITSDYVFCAVDMVVHHALTDKPKMTVIFINPHRT